MICPGCGRSSSPDAGICPHCSSRIGATAVTGVVPFDTTGLPPGATFGPTFGPTLAPGKSVFAGGATGAPEATIGPDAPDADATDATAATGVTGGAAALSRPTGPLKVGQSFGPRYHIIKLLGAGGMGAVYQAWDAELSVAVALKVIRVDRHRTASSDAEKRFKQELL